MGFPGGSDGEESTCNAGDLGSIPGWEDPLEREWLSAPVFWSGEFHGQRSLTGYSPWSHKELDMIEQLTLSTLYKDEKGLISVLILFHFCRQQIRMNSCLPFLFIYSFIQEICIECSLCFRH